MIICKLGFLRLWFSKKQMILEHKINISRKMTLKIERRIRDESRRLDDVGAQGSGVLGLLRRSGL